MKLFAVFFAIVAVLVQNGQSQVIRAGSPCGCGLSTIASPAIAIAQPAVAIAQPSVAASLADTLSLLTVSSLLADSLPLNPNVIAAVPACGPAVSYGGCGYGCGCGCGNGLGYSYIL